MSTAQNVAAGYDPLHAFETLLSVSKALQEGRTSAVELCEKVIQRVECVNPKISAYSFCLFATARQEAQSSDERRRRGAALGLLDGVPLAVKDLMDTVPALCGAGLPSLAQYRPSEDSAAVALLRAAGAVIVGVTETDAGGFGTSTPRTVNPLSPDLVAGGSSGGSAAAVASGMAFGALGTDTGGSIRIPAACCSIVGFKPTWGRVDCQGVRPLAPSFDHVGILTRSVGDLIAIQQVIDPELNTPAGRPDSGPSRIGVASSWMAHVTEDVADAMRHVERCLLNAGMKLTAVDLPTAKVFLPVHIQNALKEAFDHYSSSTEYAWPDIDVAVDSLEIGRGITRGEYAENECLRERLRSQIDQTFEKCDFIILPTLAIDVPRVDDEHIDINGIRVGLVESMIQFTALFNLTGHPVVSMPAYSLKDGRAVNIQLIGRRNNDLMLLRTALWLEQIININVDYGALIARAGELMLHSRSNEKSSK